jgi:hypothetical protein
LPLPQRAAPPLPQTGLIQAKMGAADDIKSVTGQYNASLGQTSNERSGKAILARQRESDTGTYHYVDNYARMIRYVGRQLVDLIPKIYDTERIARIIQEDGESGMVKINPMQQEPVKKIRDEQGIVVDKVYNPGVGKYDVRVITGPGFQTKRQESLEAMAQLLQGNPQLWTVAGDLFIKNMDWPGAQEMSKRFAKVIDPAIIGDDEDNPALAAAKQQIEAMNAEMQQMSGMLQNVQQSMEARDLQIKEFKADVDMYNAETKRIAAVQAGMTEQQIQDIAMGVVAAAMESNATMAMPEVQPEMVEVPPQGAMQ